jgi:RimJ/RimL family protein N-acetyltransferase
MNRNPQLDCLSIEALDASDAARIATHFARLSPDDRALRFNSALTDDAQIGRYVSQMRFGEDIVLGLVDAWDCIVGIAHGCVFEAGGERRVEAAFSVDTAHRGHGFGYALMRALRAAATERRASAIVGLCAVRNLPMRRIFEKTGMALSRDDDELEARLALGACRVTTDQSVLSGRSGKRTSKGHGALPFKAGA